MWNHAQNCSPSGDEDTNESEPNLGLKDKIEKSLDLSHYLKYLDELFGQGISESDSSSDSDECEKSQKFTDFRQPSVSSQPQDRSTYGQSNLLGGLSSLTDSSSSSSSHVQGFASFKSAENLQLESNISSSSLSSIDSGTSTLSLNISSESYHEASHSKTENNANGLSKSIESRCGTGTEEDTSGENNEEKGKKSQKKKKSGKGGNETYPRQHKPSSGGKGNNGSKGGGGGTGGPAGGSSSNDNSGSSSGSSSGRNVSGNNGSSGAKSRSGKHSLQKQADCPPDFKAADLSSKHNHVNIDCNSSANVELRRALRIHSPNQDTLFLDEDLADNFGTDDNDTFDSDLSSFPLNSILENIPDEENSISDFISLSTSFSTKSSSASTSQFGAKLFSNIAESAAAAGIKILSHNNTNGRVQSSNSIAKPETKKRKLENRKELSEKFSKLTEKQKQSRIEYLNAKRRKIYTYISRKEVVKTHRTRVATFKESLIIKRKLALNCAKQVKKNALQSQKCMKESVCKAKRLTQEMELYWKSVEKSQRDLQRKVEKEAEDKLKNEVNVLNKVRIEKLNCLISQIELFVNKLLHKDVFKVNENSLVFYENLDGVNQIVDDTKREKLKSTLQGTIERAVKEHCSLVKLLDMSGAFDGNKPSQSEEQQTCPVETQFCEISEPLLKNHQILGANWIKSLYNKGLNGILADESGLGKKAQVIGFLSHLAEVYSLYGPFLVVAPSISISRWLQELHRIAPKFKVLAHFGKPVEKKLLRQGWEKNDIHTKDASFHVVVTSYQAMIADLKHFSKIKWQYLIIDDSQSTITSSSKWMALLSFRCRNKLLLCGKPQLNSFRHLCSYLYFIIPSLFDLQKELSEWLLLELESPTSNACCDMSKDEHNLAGILKRLQDVVTQNFLLRRELQNVEIEATSSIDVQLDCMLTKRQRQIYYGLLEKANLPEIFNASNKCQPEKMRTQMGTAVDLFLQLRKTCNHPNLIEERAYSTPFWMDATLITIPHLIFQNKSLENHKQRLLERLFCIYSAINIYDSLFKSGCLKKSFNDFSTWSFLRLINLSWKEAEELFVGDDLIKFKYLVMFRSVLETLQHNCIWKESRKSFRLVNCPAELVYKVICKEQGTIVPFTPLSPFGSWRKCKTVTMLNTMEHRTLKSRKHFQTVKNCQNNQALKFETRIFDLLYKSLEYPDILQCYSSTVYSKGFRPSISGKLFDRASSTLENPISTLKLTEIVSMDKSLKETLVSNLKDNLLSFHWPQQYFPETDTLVEGCCKMMMLDKLLGRLKLDNQHILIVYYIEDTLSVLEEFLWRKKWKHDRLDDSKQNFKGNAFVYLMNGNNTFSEKYKISVRTVIFYDHDWNIPIDDQKSKVISKLDCGAHIDYYRLVCKGTIEERMIAIENDKNIVPLKLSNKQVSAFTMLKSLLSTLMLEYNPEKAWTNKSKSVAHFLPEQTSSMMVRYINDNGGLDSTSPCCSEDHEVYMDDENSDRDGDGYQNDNFNLSFDEGYMGMSPDSFENVSIKSDYEEHSSPKKIKMGRGTGKRGRPASRVRFYRRDICEGSETFRRGPGRPRLKNVGPANQGTRGRKPGRPPLTKKAETISSGLTSLSSGQNVFGFYSSPDIELS